MAGGTVGAKGKAILVYFPIVCLSDHKLASLDVATLFFIGYLFFNVQANQIRRPSVVNQKEHTWNGFFGLCCLFCTHRNSV